MNDNYPHLFTPLKVGSVTFRNRILATPNNSAADLQSQMVFFENKARGGAACVTVGEHAISSKYPVEPPGLTFEIDGGEQDVRNLSYLARSIKSYGAIANIQLVHHGEYYRYGGRKPIGPTARMNWEGLEVSEMNEEMIEEAIDAFANAAGICQRAGFDMIQLHGAHGWLLAQFVSPYYNKRTDHWGGNLENRARFPMEVIKRVRDKCGRDFPIEYRISGDELIDGGMKIDETIAFVKMIEDDIDLIHVSAGVHFIFQTMRRLFPIISFAEPGCNIYLAAEMKQHVKIPVATVGGINTPEYAEKILAEGSADIIGMGRELICDPDFPNKAREGRRKEIIPCMRCQSCLSTLTPWSNYAFGCAANPRVGVDAMVQRIETPKSSKKVVVVGGGPAGMTAAITAAERGHKVTLLEKSNALGGILKLMDYEPAKFEVKRYKDYLVDQTSKAIQDIRLNTEASPEIIDTLNADVVIAAVGSKPILPGIPGVDKEKALTAWDVYLNVDKIGRNVVVIGGGTVGCEVALFLSQHVSKVTIIEMRDEIGDRVGNWWYQIAMVEAIDNEPKVDYRVRTTCLEVMPQGVRITNDKKEEVLPADSIILCTGQAPEAETVEKLCHSGLRFCTVGDCIKPKNIMHATQTAFFCAMNIL